MKRLLGGGAVTVYLLSIIVFCGFLPTRETASATDFGVMCINAMYPAMGIELADSRDNEAQPQETESGAAESETGEAGSAESTDGAAGSAAEETKSESGTAAAAGTSDKPEVLILHTHATESYLPASSSNFHSKKEENTVRDVGNVLAASLEKKGIAVLHDTTLHDDPSYNNSYNRSRETAQALMAKYPSIKCVIDLHRDASSSTAPGATVSINGKVCAKYSYVIGTATPTYKDNLAFIQSLNKTAKEKYGGYTGTVLERGYRYNQDLGGKFLLIEIGFNRNQIEECRNAAEIIGQIMGDTLKAG